MLLQLGRFGGDESRDMIRDGPFGPAVFEESGEDQARFDLAAQLVRESVTKAECLVIVEVSLTLLRGKTGVSGASEPPEKFTVSTRKCLSWSYQRGMRLSV
ncbi:hypothetical protein [Rhodopirellula bahusiensis]|uniref:hypothetical protein n=1 Tax=Rhodopirellula bahusiensis TaxID=2014065 RepID=UPI003267D74B